ncbi:proton-conducting transporter membrane subunit [Nitrospira moscoviensis]|uniref:Formate hydrogenlyase membrane subunit F n=1 Tax=Nitrospira moscoviensis TaxID=42253 RepID=A0A088ND37_NITMO|nr:proton-conducting transporter membrane subunit [Nitrospira moscoviensis]AIN51379.1 formate hydrogenlyase membrane subunit F [Nitrospira moscoviensis]ALA60148.1 Formate hydrogenlyase, membrane subunit HyfF [Nitrospira moscoviensis]
MSDHTTLYAVSVLLLAPLVAGGLSLLLTSSRWLHFVNLASMGALVSAEVVIGRTVLTTGAITALGELVYIDALSSVILFIIGTVGLACSLYMRSYLDEQVARGVIAPSRLNLFFFLFHMFLLAMVVATIANSLGVQWVAIEAATLATTFLIAFWRRRESLEAGWKYLILCSVGISLALFGVVLMYYSSLRVLGDVSSALNVTQLQQVAAQLDAHILKLAFVFLFVGYGTKVGLVPMHSWLPDAYTEAPAPVAAMLAGVLETVAVYAIVRSRGIVDQAVAPEFTGSLLVLFGLLSFAIAAFFLLLQHNYKRLLAYSSIEHMGLTMVGFGVGGAVGTFGGLFHLINHAFAKSLAFFAAGNIHRRYRSVEIHQVQGLVTVLPGSALALIVAGLALAALPPFALFASEMQIMTALGTAGLPGEWGQSGSRGPVILLLLCSLVAFAGFLYRITGMVWGAAPHQIVRGERWSAGHLALILLSVVLMGFCWVLPLPLSHLLEAASVMLTSVAP